MYDGLVSVGGKKKRLVSVFFWKVEDSCEQTQRSWLNLKCVMITVENIWKPRWFDQIYTDFVSLNILSTNQKINNQNFISDVQLGDSKFKLKCSKKWINVRNVIFHANLWIRSTPTLQSAWISAVLLQNQCYYLCIFCVKIWAEDGTAHWARRPSN